MNFRTFLIAQSRMRKSDLVMGVDKVRCQFESRLETFDGLQGLVPGGVDETQIEMRARVLRR